MLVGKWKRSLLKCRSNNIEPSFSSGDTLVRKKNRFNNFNKLFSNVQHSYKIVEKSKYEVYMYVNKVRIRFHTGV